jgi:hypothetical protein
MPDRRPLRFTNGTIVKTVLRRCVTCLMDALNTHQSVDRLHIDYDRLDGGVVL